MKKDEKQRSGIKQVSLDKLLSVPVRFALFTIAIMLISGVLTLLFDVLLQYDVPKNYFLANLDQFLLINFLIALAVFLLKK